MVQKAGTILTRRNKLSHLLFILSRTNPTRKGPRIANPGLHSCCTEEWELQKLFPFQEKRTRTLCTSCHRDHPSGTFFYLTVTIKLLILKLEPQSSEAMWEVTATNAITGRCSLQFLTPKFINSIIGGRSFWVWRLQPQGVIYVAAKQIYTLCKHFSDFMLNNLF